MRIIKLTEQEKLVLKDLYKTSATSVIRRRCLSLLLSNDNHSMKTICSITKVGRTTLYYFFNAWQQAQGTRKV